MSTTSASPARSLGSPPAGHQAGAGSPGRQQLQSVVRRAANLLVFCLLGGVLYLGHHTGWKMPKFSELFGTAAVTADDWCSATWCPNRSVSSAT